ncbi:NAD(+) diphosphatase [Pontibacter oryzae]|nr:NAD(+) diphosphatase [Pontibacter oryzae]
MNYFSHNPLNRYADLRPDAAYMDQLWKHKKARVLVVNNNLNLLLPTQDEAAILSAVEAEALADHAQVRVYLGSEGKVPYFALGFSELSPVLVPEPYTFHDLRQTALHLPKEQSALLAYARGIVHWNICHAFCPDCGGPTHSTYAGHVRQCSHEACQKQHFPRTDTAVIVLISEGDACLLGRQQVWQPGMYAVIAGFLEPGETLEQAVAREAMEETGVSLRSITYHSSQPWPFPSSIMVGFRAVAANRYIKVDNQELEDARWFTRAQIKSGLEQGTLRMPPQFSISYRLISDWFNEAGEYTLDEIVAASALKV